MRCSLDDLKLQEMKFSNKDDIKPWLQDILIQKKGIHVAITRSDSNKIIFQCRSLRRGINTYKASTMNSRRHKTCPFKIRANFSVRNNCWKLVVINDSHDHSLDKLDGVIQEFRTPVGNAAREEDSCSNISVPDLLDYKISNSLTKTSPFSSPLSLNSNIRSSFMHSPISYPEIPNFNELKENSPSGGLDSELPKSDNQNKYNADFTPNESGRTSGDSNRLPYMQATNEAAESLFESFQILLKESIDNKFSSQDKSRILSHFIAKFGEEYNSTLGTTGSQPQYTGKMSWLSSSGNFMGSTPGSTGLLPLTPLLKDIDSQFKPHSNAAASYSMSSNGGTEKSDSISQFTSNFSPSVPQTTSSDTSSTSVIQSAPVSNNTNGSSQSAFQVIQMHINNQQLPSINSIQNGLSHTPNTGQNICFPMTFSMASFSSNPSMHFSSSSSENAQGSSSSKIMKSKSVQRAATPTSSLINYLKDSKVSNSPGAHVNGLLFNSGSLGTNNSPNFNHSSNNQRSSGAFFPQVTSLHNGSNIPINNFDGSANII